jgi:hypothetical protein
MLKYLTAIFLLISFGAQTFDKAVVMLDYYANTSSYAKTCENKAIPKMHCNGKCRMMKKMREEEKKDQQNPERRNENKNQDSSSKSFFATIPINTEKDLSPFNSRYIFASTVDLSLTVFHPPAIV